MSLQHAISRIAIREPGNSKCANFVSFVSVTVKCNAQIWFNVIGRWQVTSLIKRTYKVKDWC